MNNLLSSYSKRRLVLLVEEFGEYIIENAPELKEQFKVKCTRKGGQKVFMKPIKTGLQIPKFL